METTKRERYTLLGLALFSCIVWGLATRGCVMIYNLNYPGFVSNHIYRITYLVRVIIYLPLLGCIYKKWLPNLYYTHEKIYLRYSLLGIISIACGFFVKTKFWNHILDGCFVSPFLEEPIGPVHAI